MRSLYDYTQGKPQRAYGDSVGGVHNLTGQFGMFPGAMGLGELRVPQQSAPQRQAAPQTPSFMQLPAGQGDPGFASPSMSFALNQGPQAGGFDMPQRNYLAQLMGIVR